MLGITSRPHCWNQVWDRHQAQIPWMKEILRSDMPKPAEVEDDKIIKIRKRPERISKDRKRDCKENLKCKKKTQESSSRWLRLRTSQSPKAEPQLAHFKTRIRN
jgi:hypothetical protein